MPTKKALLVLPPLLALTVIYCGHLIGLSNSQAVVLALTLWCAIWWVSEIVPLPATSLIPAVFLPLGGVLSHNEVAASYGHSLILLLMGGFILSRGMESSGAHKKIALILIRAVGGGGKRLLFGFMLASAALSMWISNTATVLMLLPVAVAAIADCKDKKFRTCIFLGIAYAASIGGLATPIGTPPNLIFMAIYEEYIGSTISFIEWMLIATPIAVVLFLFTAFVLSYGLKSEESIESGATHPWTSLQKRVLLVFVFTAFLWVFRTSPFGGWSTLFAAELIGDSTVALLGAFLLLILPSREGGTLLSWHEAVKIPWGILILFGGGLALAKGYQVSGLSELIGQSLLSFADLPTWLLLLILCLSVTFLTEVTSNTATATLLMPILASASLAAEINPILLMVPAALSASCAFMLPVATAPNAIMYSSGEVSIKDMARYGIILNFGGAVIIVLGSLILL